MLKVTEQLIATEDVGSKILLQCELELSLIKKPWSNLEETALGSKTSLFLFLRVSSTTDFQRCYS